MRQTLLRIRLDDLWTLERMQGIPAVGLGYVVLAVWSLIAVYWVWREFLRRPERPAGKESPASSARSDRWLSAGYWLGTALGVLLLGRVMGGRIPFLPVFGYGFMLFVGFFVAAWFAARRAKLVGLESELIWDAGMWVFFSGIVGARLFYLVQYHQRVFAGKQGLELIKAAINLPDGGLVLYGGVLMAIGAYFLFCRRRKVKPLLLADVMMPSVFVGLAFGRFGCFLNGCCYGDVCALPWGVQFPKDSVPFRALVERGWLSSDAAASLVLHPTQLYMSLNALLLALLTASYFRYRPRDGAVLAVGWLTYPITRFVIEYLRSDEQWVEVTVRTFLLWGDEQAVWQTPFTISQWVSIGLFVSGLVYLAWWNGRLAPEMRDEGATTGPAAAAPSR